MKKINLDKAPVRTGSRYPAPYDEPCKTRTNILLGEAAGLTAFGVNITVLPPGAWSSQRHWHSHEDEFVYVLEGEVTLVTDAGEEILRAGDSAGFKAGVRDGHCLQNRSQAEVRFLVVGSRSDEDWGEYPDIDMKFNAGRYSGASLSFTRKNGDKI